ncbi:Integrin, alpha 5 (fibronectin receptor, alpha polypeptide) [Desmophyllum pertusum]|uniref:Integrin, alpha 5 (Fibronectin receptor, alpha polypeptide) n=1 Tax=Desmophyllum pertusum TaxID=174260 RepID=A0A9X0D790_9CNID|nr:Integrin, alpha 5 (fibronectin receptor, alpha polypeptide) [Desmophyllum pertusum]
MARTWLGIMALVACFEIVLPFNLDVKDPFIYQGTSGEYFGYSVAMHTAQRSREKWVVVGAPLGNKTSSNRERTRYGSVYKCSSDSTTCTVIRIDDSGPETTQWIDET